MKTYIGYSSDPNVRFKATSGGLGSSLMKFLFDQKLIDAGVTFSYNEKLGKYEPIVIRRFEEYQFSGSIYHEIDLIGLLKEATPALHDQSIAVFALPCQVNAIRTICQRANIKVFVLGLTCSSQQDFEATRYLFRRLGVHETDVKKIQYRGNGWPGGVTVQMNNGKELFVDNNHSIWTKIFHSRLFIMNRCFHCNDTLNKNCDIVLADPWLKEYVDNETIGKSLFAAYTDTGKKLVDDAFKAGYIVIEEVDEDTLQKAQQVTIIRKQSYKRHPSCLKVLKSLCQSNKYRKLACTNLFFPLHYKIVQKMEYWMRTH